jgi:hypothetical protein
MKSGLISIYDYSSLYNLDEIYHFNKSLSVQGEIREILFCERWGDGFVLVGTSSALHILHPTSGDTIMRLFSPIKRKLSFESD